MVRPLLSQVLNEAGDFPVKLHHHPGKDIKRVIYKLLWYDGVKQHWAA